MAAVTESPLDKTIRADNETGHSFFFFWMAVACFAVAVIGFAPTFWSPMAQGKLEVAPIIYLHAALFYGWTLLLMWQTWLVAAGQTARHRELGVAGVALATAMCFAGLGAAVYAMKKADAAGLGVEGRSFSILAVSNIVLLAPLVTAAICYVRKPEVHKRLMLVATVQMLPAAIARWFVLFFSPASISPQGGLTGPGPVTISILPALLADSLILVGMIHDKRTRGCVHPAYWIGGGCVVAVQLLRVPLSATSGWARVTDWLVALAP
jgi:hypothetical protein